uniref:Uncharacterized protein n=1 Tax=Steinernema glaseri TaxID=37863 RepID=A0A1I7XXD1_9BILA
MILKRSPFRSHSRIRSRSSTCLDSVNERNVIGPDDAVTRPPKGEHSKALFNSMMEIFKSGPVSTELLAVDSALRTPRGEAKGRSPFGEFLDVASRRVNYGLMPLYEPRDGRRALSLQMPPEAQEMLSEASSVEWL